MWHFYAPDVSPSMGTSLPADPVDGQEFTLVDSMSAPTYSWKLRYVSAKSSNKWVYVGGTPMYHEILTDETSAVTAYGDIATVGPTLTVPVAGSYRIEFGCITYTATNVGTRSIAVKIGAAAASDNDGTSVGDTSTEGIRHSMKHAVVRTAAASDVLKIQYKRTAGTAHFLNRWMFVSPVAIGG